MNEFDYPELLTAGWHVSPSPNRESILTYGLDWRRMSIHGLAASARTPVEPEAEGIFLARSPGEVEFLLSFGQHPLVDVWEVDVRGLAVDDVDQDWPICPTPIPPERLRLVRTDVPAPAGQPERHEALGRGQSPEHDPDGRGADG